MPARTPARIGRQIERPQRADLAVADEAARRSRRATIVLSNTVDRLSARPFVAAFVKRQIDLIGGDASDFHRLYSAVNS